MAHMIYSAQASHPQDSDMVYLEVTNRVSDTPSGDVCHVYLTPDNARALGEALIHYASQARKVVKHAR
jgi:hypothetical protein